MRKRIEQKLISLGIYPNLKGFGYIADIIEDNHKITNLCQIYSKVAKKNGVEPESVERNIRTAKNKIEAHKNLTNGEFLALLVWENEEFFHTKVRVRN